ncbi:MAG: CocE/NonD family hydrolase [Nitrososphaerales archaeon]
MFGAGWRTSERKYKVLKERDRRIKMSDGVELDADIFRPDTSERFPAILSIHPYSKAGQIEPIKVNSHSALTPHQGEERTRGSLEAGDPYFYARRGYVHIVANVRGTGKSQGLFEFLGRREVEDAYEMIEWAAKQEWCDGNVGMFGVSYFAMTQLAVSALNPPHLKCIFAPWGTTDIYRDMFYQGGILASNWATSWPRTSFVYGNVRPRSISLEKLGEKKFGERISLLMQDEDICGDPKLLEALQNPEKGFGKFITDILIHSLYDEFWEERRAKTENSQVPSYIGGDWGIYRSHLPAAFRSWETIKAPKLMIIGPSAYLDRPLYQLQYESLRWFDYWLKGVENGIMKEAPVRLFIDGRWKNAQEWPLPETKWTPFYLHEGSLLSERDYWVNEGSSSYFDSPWSRGFIEFFSPTLVEDTEVIGPIFTTLHAATTDTELLFSLRVLEENSKGDRKVLTAGWLRGTHRRLEESYLPYHSHSESEPLDPGKIYEYKIAIVPTGNLFRAGSRIGLRISSVDYDKEGTIAGIGSGHLKHQHPSRITVFHSDEYPSSLTLPVTSGNVIGTYMSGGKPYV